MNALNRNFVSLAVPRTFYAVVADTVPGSAEQTQVALAACGGSTLALSDPFEVERAVQRRPPELVIVDIDFGGRRQGLRLADALERHSRASVIVIGAELEDLPGEVLSDRCHVLTRPIHASQLRTTIRVALERRARRAEEPRIVRAAPEPGLAAANRAIVDRLRPRERQIVNLLLQHYRVPAVARELGISAHTVRNHLKNVFRRLAVGSQQELLLALRRE